ncbi:MAG: lipopolysaccharide biosynthesis protein RfbH [Actinobacteria bacterium]|nr:lipopolysaccharide biosynthesis protein RfbH [Actinomycetota bacterium]
MHPDPEHPDALRHEIAALVARYQDAAFPRASFEPGVTPVPVSGKVFDASEMQHLVDASLDFWLTTGRFADEFETRFAPIMGAGRALLCNSGSSANLLALSALTSPQLGERALRPGDEVITCASGFPTTVNPIYQLGLVPVFVDVDPGTLDADLDLLAQAVGPRTRAVMMAHTLGNPFDLDVVTDLCKRHGMWLIEDTCDAVGAMWRGRPAGSFGALGTVSFYPAHHVTMGEGGCVLVNEPKLERIVESFRDWGRDCWCAPGMENTCGRRFGWHLGELPFGYDHKYVYSHLGYNLKLTDMQAAVGVAQLAKLDGFVAARRRSWARLHDGLCDVQELALTHATPGSDPSWFGFAMSVRPDAGFDRYDLVTYLESRRIATRLVFGGNLLRQPAYLGRPHRAVGTMVNADAVAERSFWIGCYPGLTDEMLDYVIETIRSFVRAPVHAPRRDARAS